MSGTSQPHPYGILSGGYYHPGHMVQNDNLIQSRLCIPGNRKESATDPLKSTLMAQPWIKTYYSIAKESGRPLHLDKRERTSMA